MYPFDSSSYTGFDVGFFISVLVGVVGAVVWARLRRRHPHTSRSSSILIATYMSSKMVEISRGERGGWYYSVVAVTGDENSVIYRIDLPFMTQVHLLAIPKAAGVLQIQPGGTMEPVDLEGDFPNYFSLFAEKDLQTEVRYVLDPKAMDYVVSFCRTHSWEILGDELLFVEASGSDTALLWPHIEQFIAQIRPSIEKPISVERQMQRTPYRSERRQLRCPLCPQSLVDQSGCLACPDGHGILLFGGNIQRVRSGEIQLPVLQHLQPVDHGNVICPSCKNKMVKTEYGRVMIDSCEHCPYRWFDAGELQHIAAV